MAYRLKCIRYEGRECHILLQNENGPCPLIAAANCLLLEGRIQLPASAIRNNVASLSDLTNILANYAMETAHNTIDQVEHSFRMHELLEQIPPLQYGMDINPKFTAGIHGYEYTAQLHCFDTWRVSLCHGWLLDPHETSEDLYAAVGQKTYNEIIDLVIQGNEAEQIVSSLEHKIAQLRAADEKRVVDDLLLDNSAASDPTLESLIKQRDEASQKATIGSWIDHFLHETGHQLTQYGLNLLHQDLPEKSVAVFFRNNHFNTITRREGSLYLLVTDLGYANTPQIVWEKLDVIDGDTEYVNSLFKTVGQVAQEHAVGANLSPEALLAQSGQKDADYHLALHLSMNPNGNSENALDAREGELMAAATEASLREYHRASDPTTSSGPEVVVGVTLGDVEGPGHVAVLPPTASSTIDTDHLLALQLSSPSAQLGPNPLTEDMASLRLAQQLQAEEDQRAAASVAADRRRHVASPRRPPPTQQGSKNSNCCVM